MNSETLNALLRIFGWSLNALLTGVAPEVDWQNKLQGGTPTYIAGGGGQHAYRCAVTGSFMQIIWVWRIGRQTKTCAGCVMQAIFMRIWHIKSLDPVRVGIESYGVTTHADRERNRVSKGMRTLGR